VWLEVIENMNVILKRTVAQRWRAVYIQATVEDKGTAGVAHVRSAIRTCADAKNPEG